MVPPDKLDEKPAATIVKESDPSSAKRRGKRPAFSLRAVHRGTLDLLQET